MIASLVVVGLLSIFAIWVIARFAGAEFSTRIYWERRNK